jgi:uncharacterized protein YdaU (DUF1376 family)
VNFYKRFIGDIQAKTGNLSLAEFGAYDRLLDHYFSTESALPAEIDECYRICRAMDKDERKAVDKVLARFFSLTVCGYTQTKADEVLADALPKIETARSNGKKGGRPPKQNPVGSKTKPSGFTEITQDITQEAENEKASQSQSQNLSDKSERRRATRLPAEWTLPEEWAEWARTTRPDLDPLKVADKFRDYWVSKPGKAGVHLDWLATWRNWVREERQQFKSAPAESLAWYETRHGVEKKALSIGLEKWIESEEQYPVYKARIMKAAKEKAPSFGLNLDQLAGLAASRTGAPA